MDFSANVRSVETLAEFKMALGQFGGDLQQSLSAIWGECAQVGEWLNERERYWQSQIRQGTRGAEQELYNVQRWIKQVEQAALNYQRQAYKLANQLNNEVPKAGAFLERKIVDLNAYISLSNQSVATMQAAEDDTGGKPIGNPATGSQKHQGTEWHNAQQGVSGLWFKPGVDDRNRKHLLVSDNQAGVDGGSHDHYWENADGSYGVQLRDKSGMAVTNDRKGHIYPTNTTFPALANEYLKNLFINYF